MRMSQTHDGLGSNGTESPNKHYRTLKGHMYVDSTQLKNERS